MRILAYYTKLTLVAAVLAGGFHLVLMVLRPLGF